MSGTWNRDYRDLTILEYIYAPLTLANMKSRNQDRPKVYQYYDSPEGQDLLAKMWVTTKWGVGIGSFLSFIDLQLYAGRLTYVKILDRAAFYLVPITSMFVTYSAVSYAATNIRGKDDPLNSALAGGLAGSLAGVWLKSGRIGSFSCLIVGLFCAMRKHSADVGYKMFNPALNHKAIFSHKNPTAFDFSRTPIGNRGWTTVAE